jgi:hypothetical protein
MTAFDDSLADPKVSSSTRRASRPRVTAATLLAVDWQAVAIDFLVCGLARHGPTTGRPRDAAIGDGHAAS